MSSIAGSVLSIAILIGTNEVVLDAWLNSSFVLSRLSFPPSDMPRLVLQLGLVLLFLGATSFVALLAHATGGESRRGFITDAAAFVIAYGLSVRFGLEAHVLLSALPLLAARNAAICWRGIREVLSRPGALFRAATYGALGIVAVTAFYPALAYFRETTIRDFVETTVRPVVLQHDSSRTDAVLQVAEAIDRMEARGELSELGRSDMAFEIWLETGLASSSLSSAIEILDGDARMMSRFALSYPLVAPSDHPGPAPSEWLLIDESVESDPNHPGVLMARSVAGPDGRPWEIHVRLAADWKNLPFISTRNPYLNLFRTRGFEAGSRFPYRELYLSVMELDGRPVFQSTEGLVPPPGDVLDRARKDALWWRFSRDGEVHEAHVFADEQHVYVLSYPRTALLTFAAELASWAVLAASLAAVLLLSWLGLGALKSPWGVPAGEIWATIGTSFSGKLYVAFVLIALIPIALLAFLTRGLVIGQLQEDVEQEGTSRAHVVERLVGAFPRAVPADGTELSANVTDAILERVGALAGVDVDVYAEGELVATSKPELFGSGLLKTRAVPSAYRKIVLERRIHSIHRQSVGSFQYLVASAPVELQPSMEPGILSIPLASREAEISRRVSALDDALLLAALGLSIAALSLAYSLAKRIAGPVNALTEATHRVAGGDLDVSLQTESKDEIGTLFASFIQMTADLKRQRADLERTKKLEAWAEMARQVAHEVKNPLTPIQLSTEHLLRVYTDPDVDFESVLRECSDTILEQVKTLRQISMEFSTFASPEPLKPEDTDVGELLRDTVEPYLTAPPDGVTVELDQAGELPRMRVDRRLLKRTLLNLIENALHAVGDGGVIRIQAKPTRLNGGGFVELTVTDTGVGIESEIAERIFEPYFSTRATGTGLGLAIAKKVVADHGGTIALESEPGRGTRVTIHLPMDSPD